MRTTKPSAMALNPTIDRIGLQGNGSLAARKIAVTTVKQSVAIPARFSSFILRNSGTNAVRINFNTDAAAQYFTLAVGAQLPSITVNDKAVIHFLTASGTSELEAILWG